MASKHKSANEEIEVTYGRVIYTVGLNFQTVDIDDSFNGDRHGGLYVFKSSHKEINPETIVVKYIESDLDYAIKPSDIDEKFYDAIVAELMSKDLN